LLDAAATKEPAEVEELLAVADSVVASERTRYLDLDQRYLSLLEDHQFLEEENTGLRAKLDYANRKLRLIEPPVERT
jgi:hypothetical protein